MLAQGRAMQGGHDEAVDCDESFTSGSLKRSIIIFTFGVDIWYIFFFTFLPPQSYRE